jgi:hypothetical protein
MYLRVIVSTMNRLQGFHFCFCFKNVLKLSNTLHASVFEFVSTSLLERKDNDNDVRQIPSTKFMSLTAGASLLRSIIRILLTAITVIQCNLKEGEKFIRIEVKRYCLYSNKHILWKYIRRRKVKRYHSCEQYAHPLKKKRADSVARWH